MIRKRSILTIRMRRLVISWATLVSFLILAAGPALALGSREDPLRRADALIAEQRYDEAILYISEFIKANPDRFDEAQGKLRQISRLRQSYNQSYLALIEAIANPGTSETEKIALIERILREFPPTNPTERAFIAEAYELALFTANNARFAQIMAEGRALIDAGSYMQAARVYESGFELYQLQFRQLAEVGDELKTDSLARVQAISSALSYLQSGTEAMQAAFVALRDSYGSLAVAGAAELDAAQASFNAALGAAQTAAFDYFGARSAVREAGLALRANVARYKAETGVEKDSSFLPFAFRLALGRPTEERLEGVLGALDAAWISSLSVAQSRAEEGLRETLAAARRAYDSGSWEEASASFTRVGLLADSTLPLFALRSLYAPSELLAGASPLGRADLDAQGQAYLSLLHAAQSARDWGALARLQAVTDAEGVALAAFDPGGLGLDAALAGFDRSRGSFAAQYTQAEELRRASGARAERLAAVSASAFAEAASAELQGSLDGSIANFATKARGFEVAAVARAAAYERELLSRESAEAIARVEEGRRLLAGLPSDDPLLPDALFRYPSRALDVLARAERELSDINRRIAAFVARYRAEPPYAATAPAVLETIERATAQTAANVARAAEGRELTARAQEQKRQADSARLEAERRAAEAQAALRANNFEIARERLDRSRERYLASLNLEQDPTMRASSDRLLAEIAAAILRAQNEFVVADTRRLLNEGRARYLDGDFDRAESLLLQARARWNTTNAAPETEVEYWLKLVQTALSVKTGRDIPVTAPLYPEMSQLISLAKQYYDAGAALLSRRDRVGALSQFALARQKIADVKVIFPLNQEARVLELRIDQLVDADAFNRQFARLFDEARAKVNSGTDLTTAYSDLKDLEAINARYPGLRALIEQAEIRLGFRPPPPDPRALAEARELATAAQRIFDSGDTARFPLARTQLDRALLLDPNNQAAARLKDRIATIIGGSQTFVLPASAEALFNEAVSLFSRAEYIAARARLARLYAGFAQADRVQKVGDLDARLSALGY